MINFSQLKSLTIPEGPVSRLLWGYKVVWQKQKKLPAGYVLLDYIETTDAQYIDTGFVPNNNSRLVADFVSTAESGYNDILGCRNTTSSRGFAFSTTTTKWRFGYGRTVETSAPWDTDRHIVDMNKNVLSLDRTVIHTADATTFTCPYSLCLGAIQGSSMYLGQTRFYSCKIYDNGTLVRDLVPCINPDGQIGMYDWVSGVFYGNAGTGEFIYGHAFVEYVEGDGASWIDTGFVADSDSKVVMDCQSMGVGTMSSAQAFFGARTGTTLECFAVYWHKGDSSYRYYYDTNYGSKKIDRITERIIITADQNVATIGDYATLTRPVATFNGSYPIFLCAMNNAGEVMGATKLRVYSCKIYDGTGTLVRDYIPCRTYNGEYGLYDRVNGVFCANAGTGAFSGA